jgi:riboflavin synthase
MFTGLITGVGKIRSVTPIGDGADARFVIETPDNEVWRPADIRLGASIACSGCCLTVIEYGADWFSVEVSAESLNVTTLGGWQAGSLINLEGSLRLGAEMGGHLVSGHVDGIGIALSASPENGSVRWKFLVPREIAKFIATKGSVAIDGVSLTVNEVEGDIFGVNIIPHTAANTSFGALAPGAEVNIEIDMLARYVARQLAFQNA